MARPRQHAPEALHAKVMAACSEWLASRSVHHLSLRSLARDIGCAPSTLLKLYGSFNNLLQYVNIGTLAILRSTVDARSHVPAEELLGALAASYWSFAHDNPYRWELLFDYPLAQEGELDQRQNVAIEELFVVVHAALKEICPSLDEVVLSRMARTLWGSVHGLVQLGLNDRLGQWNGKAYQVPELLDQLLDMTLAGLKASCPLPGASES
ncbi:TetR/AcrR family transcriptional regulator [Zymobacter sp. IVIA_5232.4 C2]|uniref:TetR/AcrR family transcriptional regulator n=1 Tax=Zymobacter sp. IVIA_5232.4 C2 TaxID=3394855 RepID=UPI0039C02F87